MEGMYNEKYESERVSDTTFIKDIPVIEKEGVDVFTRKDLENLVEAPLLEACEELYDKNIQTVMSSCNQKDLEHNGKSYIDIDFDSLSEINKVIACQFGELFEMHGARPRKCVKLVFPLNEESTAGDIRKMSHEVISQFEKQQMWWVQKYTLDDLANIYMIPKEKLVPSDIQDMYYDKQSGYFYKSEEQYKKANNIE